MYMLLNALPVSTYFIDAVRRCTITIVLNSAGMTYCDCLLLPRNQNYATINSHSLMRRSFIPSKTKEITSENLTILECRLP